MIYIPCQIQLTGIFIYDQNERTITVPKQIQKRSHTINSESTYHRIFSTSELPLAAFARCAYKLPLTEVTKSSNGKVVWTFELMDKDENSVVHEFHTNGLVQASQFYNELKTLRSMTYTL